MVEHAAVNRVVVGSSPTSGANVSRRAESRHRPAKRGKQPDGGLPQSVLHH